MARSHASSPPSSAAEPIHQDSAMAKQLHDRMLFLLGNLTGSLVEATVKDGSKFKGIFHGASTEGDLGIALKLAQKIYDPHAPIDKDKTNPNPIKNTMLIFSKDLVEINAVNVNLTSSSTEPVDRNTFKTDTDISGKLDIKERELQKWTPTEDDGSDSGLLEGGLETSNESGGGGSGGSWDQFAANEKLFGLKTDFDEEIYTTVLNRSAPGYKDREKHAIKVANEIQKTATTNVHLQEERGLAIDDSGMDEEDLYGAVVRDANPNRYVPPALRKMQQQQPQPLKKEKAMNPLNKLMTSDLPKAVSNPSPIADLPTTRRESSDRSSGGVGGSNSSSTADKNISTDKNNSNEPHKRIEAEIATRFRHFAKLEKDKLHAKKQALQKKEKDDLLTELKKFNQTFKLNVPVPADLVPLLSKRKAPPPPSPAPVDGSSSSSSSKVDPPESSKNSPVKKPIPSSATATASTTTSSITAPTNTEKKSIVPNPAVSSASSAAPPPAPATTTATAATTGSVPASSNSFKFNVKASSFKPNPSAAAFVPGGSSSGSGSSNNLSMGIPVAAVHTDEGNPHTFFNGRHQHHHQHQQQQQKKGGPVEHLTMTEAFVPPFLDKDMPASTVGPTWPFGHKSYRVQFSQFGYDEDVYNYPSPNYGYYPQYRYPFPQMPYPQFVQPPPMPPTYSPQMAASVSPHGSPFPPPPPPPHPQGFSSPQRSPMVPQQMPPPQMYQYGGPPMMMHYRPEMMQRPVMVETVPYYQQDPTPPPPPPARVDGDSYGFQY
ncbi:hypothetical protein [Parasitella parasitica]|uniref:LsmAD domain-containing protein n=1 Tax=Parasitella parasitica TaxID=35722 RepID=A0A0B7NA97_9FUNG|nr:hypothetical protein [Parasitella parasitica]